jgi:competence protein ComEA
MRAYLQVLLLGVVAITSVCLALRWHTLAQQPEPLPPLAQAAEQPAAGDRQPGVSTPLYTPPASSPSAAPTPPDRPAEATAQIPKEGTPAAKPGGKVDINTANAAQFETLPGIGPVLAQRIVAYRQAHGLFKTIAQLQDVEGIGPKKFADLEARVYVGSVH